MTNAFVSGSDAIASFPLKATASRPTSVEIWQAQDGAWLLQAPDFGGVFATRADAMRWAREEAGAGVTFVEREAHNRAAAA